MVSESEIKNLLLKKNQKERICDSCGNCILIGDYYYSRTTPTLGTFCKDCRKKNVNNWSNNRRDYNDIIPKIASDLDTVGYIETKDLEQKYSIHSKLYDRTIKKLHEFGYIIKICRNCKSMEGASNDCDYWVLVYSPIVCEFLESMQLSNVNSDITTIDEINNRYKDNKIVISNLLSSLLDIKYDFDLNINEGAFKLYIKYLQSNVNIEELLNQIYLERICFDDDVYDEIMKDNRDLVMTYFVELLFSLSDMVVLGEYGCFTINGEKKVFSVITDESMLDVRSGCDVDIVITSDEISCLINDDSEDICNILEYLDLKSNEEAHKIVKMMMKLMENGF